MNASPSAKTILLVDDRQEFLDLIGYQLESLHYLVRTASNGRQALSLIQRDPPDMVLLDAMMPGMDGFEVLRELRAKPGGRSLPVVMLTALDEVQHRIAALEAGADGYLTKPVHIVELQAKMRSLLMLQDSYRELEQQRAQFMAMLIHDMRSPLTSMGMFLELLEEEIPGPLNEEQRSILESCQVSNRRLLDIVNHVLDFSKLEAGQLQPALAAVTVAGLTRHPTSNAAIQARNLGVTFAVDIHRPETMVRVDQGLIEQVLTNLLDNALKATLRDGTVTLRGTRTPEGYRFAVEDTGSGIPKEELERIFLAYEQGRQREGRPRSGSGLGLTVSKLLVEAHGSRLEVQSDPGHGSCFAFTLGIPD